MAAVPVAYTPPLSSQTRKTSNGRGDWDYSVPIDGRDNFIPTPDRRNDNVQNQVGSGVTSLITNDPNVSAYSQKINGYHSPPNSNDEYVPRSAGHSPDDRSNRSSEYLTAPRAPMLSRRDSTVSSNHDNDSVFDLYGGRMSVISSYDVPLPTPGVDGSGSCTNLNGTAGSAPKPVEIKDPGAELWIHRDKLERIEGDEAANYIYNMKKDRWIHKDKLERIEIEELHQAGIVTTPSASAADASQQTHKDENSDDRKELMPSPPLDNDDNGEDDNGEFVFDIRTPEEQAADRISEASNRPHRSFHRNPSYSRIPVATISPHPIPQQYLERSQPLPRNPVTPNGSEDGTGRNSISLPGARKRSYSAGSAFLLDDSPSAGTPTPGTTVNNPKNYSRSPMSPTPGGRKPVVSRNGSMAGKQRTRSNPQLHRPGTSASYSTHSGGTQGSAGKQPEGPPPWALQTYKPDPSLPPDQQIIPTLAKKLQQEQWERDGAHASVYDREMRPLKVYDNDKSEKGTKGDSTSDSKEEWPLKNSGPTFHQPEATPKEESTPEGRSSIMPNVNGPTIEPPRTIQKQKLPVSNEKEKKSKLCCCVIM